MRTRMIPRAGDVWSGRQVAWNDAPGDPEWKDGCGLIVALPVIAAVFGLLLWSLADDTPIIDDDPHPDGAPEENPIYSREVR